MPPHQKKGTWALAGGLLASSAITLALAASMYMGGIHVTTILPTSAPIWMGFATMLFMLLKE